MRKQHGPVLITGHTGFKGTWMTFLLEYLEIPVVGYSLTPQENSLFDRAERTGCIPEAFEDIRNFELLEKFIDYHKPSTILHFAAQPLVMQSYKNPRETFEVNVMGTANLLDVSFKKKFVQTVIVATTDKVYRNNNSGKAFAENDPMAGKDPYSASKVGTEAVVNAWQQIGKVSGGPNLVSVRAGNVIGGGDFAKDRIVPDLIRGYINGDSVKIRNPNSTRPWEHVVEPLIGYLKLIDYLQSDQNIYSVNFGPKDESLPVSEIAKIFAKYFKIEINQEFSQRQSEVESQKLELNVDLAQNKLDWVTTVSQIEAVEMTAKWWLHFFEGNHTIQEICENDIRFFLGKHSKSYKV